MSSQVVAGSYKGCRVNSTGICISDNKLIRFQENLAGVQILGQDSRKSALSGIGRGIVGGVILGPVGLLGGMLSAKNINTFIISVVFKDGKSCVISAEASVFATLAALKTKLESQNISGLPELINVTPEKENISMPVKATEIEERKQHCIEEIKTTFPVFTPPIKGNGIVLTCPSCKQPISIDPVFINSVGLCPFCKFEIKLQQQENTRYIYTVCQNCRTRLDGIVETDGDKIICPYCSIHFIPIEISVK